MSLIKCQECSKEISDRAIACPGCGCPVQSTYEASKPDISLTRVRQIQRNILIGEVFISIISVLAIVGISLIAFVSVGTFKNNVPLVHITLGLLSYLLLCILFISSYRKSYFTRKASSSNVVVQSLAFIVFLGCLVAGSIAATNIWGTYWSWDPKETWAAILFIIMLISTIYIVTAGNDLQKQLSVLSLEVSAICFVFFFTSLITIGLHPNIKIGILTDFDKSTIMISFAILTVIKCIVAILVARLARSKGYEFSVWILYGFSLSLISIVHIALMPEKVNLEKYEQYLKHAHLDYSREGNSQHGLNKNEIDNNYVVRSGWSWPAFFFSGIWALFNGLWGKFAISFGYCFLSVIAVKLLLVPMVYSSAMVSSWLTSLYSIKESGGVAFILGFYSILCLFTILPNVPLWIWFGMSGNKWVEEKYINKRYVRI